MTVKHCFVSQAACCKIKNVAPTSHRSVTNRRIKDRHVTDELTKLNSDVLTCDATPDSLTAV